METPTYRTMAITVATHNKGRGGNIFTFTDKKTGIHIHYDRWDGNVNIYNYDNKRVYITRDDKEIRVTPGPWQDQLLKMYNKIIKN